MSSASARVGADAHRDELADLAHLVAARATDWSEGLKPFRAETARIGFTPCEILAVNHTRSSSPAACAMPLMRACATGERTNATSSMPGRRMFATNSPRPRRKRASSLRGRRAPTPFWRSRRFARAAAGSRRRRRSARRRAGRSAGAACARCCSLVPSLSRSVQRPRSSCSTRDVGRDAGLQRADLVLHADHLRRVGGHHGHDLLERQAERQHRGHRRDEREARLAEEHVLLVRMLVRRARCGFGHARVVAVHVGAQRVRHDAGVERDARHLDS